MPAHHRLSIPSVSQLRPQFGVTLLDLTIAIAIATVLGALAAPAFKTWKTNTLVRHEANTLQHLLSSARYEAVNKGIKVRLCGVDETKTCVKSGFKTLVIFHDKNQNHIVDDTEAVFSEYAVQHQYNVIVSGFRQNYLSYSPQGNALSNGSIVLCPPPLSSLQSTPPTSRNAQTIALNGERISLNRAGRSYRKPITQRNQRNIYCYCNRRCKLDNDPLEQ